MSNFMREVFACLLGISFACVLANTGQCGLVMSDDFAYADNTALKVNWKDVVAGTSPEQFTTFGFIASGSGFISSTATQRPADLPGQTLMSLNNRSTFRDLGTTVNTSFTLTSYVATNAYARTLQIGIGDSTGAGYSFTWNAAQPTQSFGNGVFNVRKETAWTGAPTIGTTISANMNGTSPPTRYALPNPVLGGDGLVNYSSTSSVFLGYSKIELKWNSDTGQLQLFQDGTAVSSIVTDTTYNSFSRVYAGSGTRGYVDFISVVTVDAIPEPAAISLTAVGCAIMAAIHWRGRKRSGN
jgi:hypothetical protein